MDKANGSLFLIFQIQVYIHNLYHIYYINYTILIKFIYTRTNYMYTR